MVSRDSVRIILFVAILNELNVLSRDIQNAFLVTPNREKVYIRAGIDFTYTGGMEDMIGKY